MIVGSNPNPQPQSGAAFETLQFAVTMYPPQSIVGQNFILNIRKVVTDATNLATGTSLQLVYSTAAFVITDAANGAFYISVPSATIGATLGVGDFTYDIWRTDAGFEKRLAYGPLSITAEGWK